LIKRNVNKRYLTILIIILALGLFLRLHQLDTENLWVDEAYTLNIATQQDISAFSQQLELTEGAPWGHYILLYYWIKIFGNSEFSIRLPSVIFGVLSILIIYEIGKNISDKKNGLLASFMLATSMLQVLYSQEARMYAVYGFLILLSAYFFVLIMKMEKEINRKNKLFFAYGLTMILAFYFNYFTGFMIIFYSFIVLWFNKKEMFREWVRINAIVIFLSIPVIFLYLKQHINAANTGYKETLVQKGMPAILAKLGTILYTFPFLTILGVMLIAIILKYAFKINTIKYFSKDSKYRPVLFTFILLVFGIIYVCLTTNPFSLFGVPIFKKPIIHSYFLIRHSYFLVPIFYLLVSHKIIEMWSNKMKKSWAVWCISIIIMINIFSLSVYYTNTTKAEWKSTANYILSNSENTPVALLDKGGFSSLYLLDYYSQSQIKSVKLTWKELDSPFKLNENQMIKIINKEKTFWLVLSRDSKTGKENLKLLSNKYNILRSKEYYGVKIYQFSTK